MLGITGENTFIITLPKRKDRLQRCRNGLDLHGLKYTVWEAIEMKDGKAGLIATMKELFDYCQTKRLDYVLVFEDDCKILDPDFGATFMRCLQQLPINFDLLYLGCNLSEQPKRYDANLLEGQGMYSSHAVLYSIEVICKILDRIYLHDAYDKVLAKEIQPDGKSFCVYPLLVTQEIGHSDIMGREVDYSKYIETRYKEKTSRLEWM